MFLIWFTLYIVLSRNVIFLSLYGFCYHMMDGKIILNLNSSSSQRPMCCHLVLRFRTKKHHLAFCLGRHQVAALLFTFLSAQSNSQHGPCAVPLVLVWLLMEELINTLMKHWGSKPAVFMHEVVQWFPLHKFRNNMHARILYDLFFLLIQAMM